MKKLLLILSFAAIGSGCTGTGAVFISESLELGTECAPGDIAQLRGSLDIGQSSVYAAAFAIGSSATGDEVTIDGRPVNTPAANDFLGNEIVLNYAIGGTNIVAEQLVPVTLVIPAGADPDDSSVVLNLLTAPAVAAIRAQAAFPVDVIVSMFFRGSLRGGGPTSTNTVRFPITITGNTTPVTSCTAPAVLTVTGEPTCGNPSQDDGSSRIVCQ